MPSSKNTTLTRLKAQREKLDARIQAAQSRARLSERKQDTRRKILIGSFYLDKAIKENTLAELKASMNGYLTRNSDRKLFDLYTKTEQAEEA